MSSRSIINEKQYLKEKITEFQRNIAQLSRSLTKQQDDFSRREKELLVALFEVLDAFDNLEKAYAERAGALDKTAARLLKGMRTISGKLRRILQERNIIAIEFTNGKISMEHCRIIDTKRVANAENESIISIEKTGYIDIEKNIVLRKADVVTVLNE
ncbi:MAG: nucleotide exchange factor GrpE [Deltaproteobacteria bacterium]|nr:nucleotide exchange factor GrpE [Deltaproteobacteria bacterium]